MPEKAIGDLADILTRLEPIFVDLSSALTDDLSHRREQTKREKRDSRILRILAFVVVVDLILSLISGVILISVHEIQQAGQRSGKDNHQTLLSVQKELAIVESVAGPDSIAKQNAQQRLVYKCVKNWIDVDTGKALPIAACQALVAP